MTPIVPPYSEPREPVGTVVELFAGVGGFRLGLARSGWKTIFSNQWEPSTKVQHVSDCYVYRFGSNGHTNEDIEKVLDSFLGDRSETIDIPNATMVVGGLSVPRLQRCQDTWPS